ncbi:L,D-transpeptidase [Allobranchiibius sp. GilTou38]|uniref:L,D-transpeptidase n=1 Tax=Allobranchiibius sp. GilTou38 TaxID=2815210 RepID=UPI001AA1C48D|nr:L,D-transpeptidase [Allobranchiibius sp. GilTou38]MBO1765410.1 L,D-transpeptidase [Allobranchiibius sp. GilTou38]
MAGRFGRDSGAAQRMGVRVAGVIAGFVVLALVVLGVHALRGGSGPDAATSTPPSAGSPSGSGGSSSGATSSAVVPVPPVSAAQLAALPRSTTFTTVHGLPSSSGATSDGNVVRIAHAQVGFDAPGGSPKVVIPATQLGLDTWLPIVDRRSGWYQVRLPSRPNGSLAWIPAAGMRTAQTDWRVHISLAAGRMTVMKGTSQMGEWTVGHGKDATPTPVGQTFLLAGFVDPSEIFSPVIYALGAHSDSLDTFGGGPGTVAVHGWPTAAGRIGKISHGCVRVPAAALSMFAKLPTGTPVDITAS